MKLRLGILEIGETVKAEGPLAFLQSYGFTILVSFIVLAVLIIIINKSLRLIPNLAKLENRKKKELEKPMKKQDKGVVSRNLEVFSSIKKAIRQMMPKKESTAQPEPKKEERADIGIDIKKKYPRLPSSTVDRMEVEIAVAKKINQNKGCFSVSEVMKTMEQIYSGQIKKEDRIPIFHEIRDWVGKEEFCKKVRQKGDIPYYKIIYI